MNYRKLARANPFMTAVLILGLSPICFAQAQERSAWVFQMEGQTVSYMVVEDGKWVFARPQKTLNELKEIERNDTEIVLQNTRTQLLIRLTSAQSYWKRPHDSEWKSYYRGKWSTPPESVHQWIAEKTETPSKTNAEGADEASDADYRVRVIYFVPSDRRPVRNWEQKIRVLVYFVNSFYHQDLQAKGLKTNGLDWELTDAGNGVRVHLARGQRTASFYNDMPLFDKNSQFQRIKNELRTTDFGKPGTLRLVLCETYDPGPSDLLWKGTFALGGYHSARDGLAMFSAHILRDEFCATTPQRQIPKFFDKTPMPGRRAMGHSMNSPRCEFVEDGFGAVIHELGHALGLPHDFRNHDRYIMGNGFRQLARNFDPKTPSSRRVTFSDVSTLLLSTSRFLNPAVDRNDNEYAEAEMEIYHVDATRNQARITLSGTDDLGLLAFAVIDSHAQSPVVAGALTGKQFERAVTVNCMPKVGEIKFTLILVDQGGNQTRVTRSYALSP